MKYIFSHKVIKNINDNYPPRIAVALSPLVKTEYTSEDSYLNVLSEKLESDDYERYYLKLLKLCEKDEYLLSKIITASIPAIIVIYAIVIFFTQSSGAGNRFEASAQFGDSFGVVNTLFTGLAFGCLIITILLQRNDLQLQREELKLTRKELKGQRIEMKKQSELMDQQYQSLLKEGFENTFFRLLSYKREIVESMKIRIGHTKESVHTEHEYVGFDFLEYMLGHFLSDYCRGNMHKGIYPALSPYERFYKINDKYFSQYHKHLYQIVSFVDDSNLTTKDKKRYLRFLRSQLTSGELLLLAFHCLSPYGIKKFKPLIERFNLLEHLPINDELYDHKNILKEYNDSAFGKNTDLLEFKRQA